MRIRAQKPKLGALCRWVRDLDVVSGLAEQVEGTSVRSEKEKDLLVVLDSILRLTGPTDYSMLEKSVEGPIAPMADWDLRANGERRKVYDSVLDKSIFGCLKGDIKSQFRTIEITPGLERKPANLHPAILHASRDDAILLSSKAPKSTHHKHPTVPNLHLLQDILSPSECDQIIASAETIGFTPDAPIRAEGEESSVLAHNFYWVVDDSFNAKLWERVKSYVPADVGGKKVRGLNRRFRVYRYVPGAEYRAHIGMSYLPSNYLLVIANTPKMVHGHHPQSTLKQTNTSTTPLHLQPSNLPFSLSSYTSTTSFPLAKRLSSSHLPEKDR